MPVFYTTRRRIRFFDSASFFLDSMVRGPIALRPVARMCPIHYQLLHASPELLYILAFFRAVYHQKLTTDDVGSPD
jgi:hypothetical protein